MQSNELIKPNNYTISPAVVRYDKRLPPLARLLYEEILSLSMKDGACYVSDGKLAEWYGTSRQTISNSIQKLSKLGYISVKTVRKGEQKTTRIINPMFDQFSKQIGSQKNLRGLSKKFDRGSQKNLRRLSKKFDTIIRHILLDNIIKRNKKLTRERVSTILSHFENLTDYQAEKLQGHYQANKELFEFELERVVNRQHLPKKPVNYLLAILDDLQAKGITTLDEAMDDHQEEYAQREFEGAIDHGQRKAKPYRRQKKGQKVEQLPEWAADDYQPETGQVTHEEADRLGDLINDVAAKKDTDPDRPQWLDDDVPF